MLLLFATIFTIKVSAYNVTLNDKKYDFGEVDLKTYTLVFEECGKYYLVTSDLQLSPYLPNNQMFYFYSDGDNRFYSYVVNKETGEFLENYSYKYTYGSETHLYSQLVYSNYDIYNSEHDLVFHGSSGGNNDLPKYFTFTYNYVTYNLLMEDQASGIYNFSLNEKTAIFKDGNILTIFTTDGSPYSFFTDNTLYMCCDESVGVYYYDLNTNRCTTESQYYSGGIKGKDFPLSTNKLVFSNFVLYDEVGHVLFQPPVLFLATVLDTAEPVNIIMVIIHLLPVILPLIIFYLGLRKAIKFLHRKAQSLLVVDLIRFEVHLVLLMV